MFNKLMLRACLGFILPSFFRLLLEAGDQFYVFLLSVLAEISLKCPWNEPNVQASKTIVNQERSSKKEKKRVIKRQGAPSFELDQRVAVVTGGGNGLGAATAEAFAVYGARVAVLDKDEGAAAMVATRIGNGAAAYGCDISDEQQVISCIARIRRDLGPISILQNGAAVHLGYGRGDEAAHLVTAEAWRKVMSVNLDGMFFVTKHVLPDMVAQKKGSIINLSSLGGGVLGSLNTAYAATKGAVVGFTRALVIGYAGTGVRANVICPGLIITQMTRPAEANERDFARYAESVPAGRVGEVSDIGGLSVFLASDASAYINGALITLDGGISLR